MNLPNILSVSRILFLVPIIIFFENDFYIFSVATFIVAAFTDLLDGYFARKHNQSSDSGALLDLLADKLFVSILLIWMTFNFDNLIVFISAVLIVSREISISYLRLFIISQSNNIKEVKSDLLGKYKTTFQMIGLGLLLISPIKSDLFNLIGLTLIFLSALISWYSFMRYLKKWIV
jgi:CDP-diacylglycerol--glycerol-3-phosphate 3-phosphatidyltransferase